MEQHIATTTAPWRPAPAGSPTTTLCGSAPEIRRLFLTGVKTGTKVVVARTNPPATATHPKTTSRKPPGRESTPSLSPLAPGPPRVARTVRLQDRADAAPDNGRMFSLCKKIFGFVAEMRQTSYKSNAKTTSPTGHSRDTTSRRPSARRAGEQQGPATAQVGLKREAKHSGEGRPVGTPSGENGGPSGARTLDTRIKSPVLCQLS